MNANPVQFLHDADSGTPFTSDPGGTTYIEQGVDQHSTYFLNGGAAMTLCCSVKAPRFGGAAAAHFRAISRWVTAASLSMGSRPTTHPAT